MREVRIAENAGFCFGVKNAVATANKMLEDYSGKQLIMLGELTHNTHVVEELVQRGFKIVDSCAEVPEDSYVIIRAHGITPQEKQLLFNKSCHIFDCTCPFVNKIHNIVREQSLEGRNILVIGTKGHPEVVGICGEAINTEVAVISSIEELEQVRFPLENCCVVSQTTFSKETFDKIVKFIKKKFANIVFFDTICNTTVKRQREAAELAESSDVMLVLGSGHSSNTK